jgi:hypothetical protein
VYALRAADPVHRSAISRRMRYGLIEGVFIARNLLKYSNMLILVFDYFSLLSKQVQAKSGEKSAESLPGTPLTRYGYA